MPNLQVLSLIIEHPLASQLHAEDEEAEQLCQSATEDVEPEIEFESVAQVVDGILPERAVLVQGYRAVVNLKERGMVYRGAAQQAEQFHGLDGQQADDAPDRFRGQVTDRDEQQAIACVEHEDVAVVEGHIDEAEHEKQTHAPGEAAREVFPPLLLVVVHDEETQTEEHGKDTIHLSGKQPCQHVGHRLVTGQRVQDGIFREDVEVLHRVIQYNACHRYAPQGIGHINARVGEFASCIHVI